MLIALVLLGFQQTIAQTPPPDFEASYSIIPKGDGDAGYNITQIDFRKLGTIKTKKPTNFFTYGLSATQVHISYKDESFQQPGLTDFYRVGVPINYVSVRKNNWIMTAGVIPQLSSNFQSDIQGRDLLIDGYLLFVKRLKRDRPSSLTVGAIYANSLGYPFPIPYISYWVKGKHIEWNLGLPRTSATYAINEKSNLRASLSLQGSNFNLSNNIALADGKTAQRVQINAWALGLNYERYITKSLILGAEAGLLINNQYQLLDNKQDEVGKFDVDNGYLVRLSLGYRFGK